MNQKFLDNKLYNIWNKVPINYYQKGVKTNILRWIWHYHKIQLAKKIIKKIEFENCLDVGCASGYMISEIAMSYPNARYFGIDVFDKAISYAKKIYPHINFRVATAEDLPFRSNSMDLILNYETIEHVENPLKCLQEIRRVLKEKGTLILAMDSGSFLFRTVWFFWENSFGKVWQKAHLHPFHHFELEDLVKKAGFKIKEKMFSHLGMETVFLLSK
ncbi:MAG: methyltransferase domain-containing protein [Candidatus Daviesbacteria bacterium]|nr:methyltransferase domain-containing protein [Candidatus Daviesbacteria bacterium]